MAYVSFENVVRQYGEGDAAVYALDGATFQAEQGELAVILGASGAGKTTALNILGGMDSPTSGEVFVADATSPSSPASWWNTAAPTSASCSSSTTWCPI